MKKAATLMLVFLTFNAFSYEKSDRQNCNLEWLLSHRDTQQFVVQGSEINRGAALRKMLTLVLKGGSLMTNLDPLGIPRYRSVTVLKSLEHQMATDECAASYIVTLEELCVAGMKNQNAQCRDLCTLDSQEPECR